MSIRSAFPFLLAIPMLCSASYAADVEPQNPLFTYNISQKTNVSAVITDAETGQPVNNYKITIGEHIPPEPINWYPLHSFAPFNILKNDNAFSISTKASLKKYVFHIAAPGYEPQYSHEWNLDTDKSLWNIKLKPAKNITGKVVASDGNTVYDAQLIIVLANNKIKISGPSFEEFNPTATQKVYHDTLKPLNIYKSDIDGTFLIPPQNEDYRIVALSPEGYQLIEHNDIKPGEENIIKLGDWTTLTGSITYKDKPIKGQLVQANYTLFAPGAIEDAFKPLNVDMRYTTKTLPDGTFKFDYIPFQFVNIVLVHKDPTTGNLLRVKSSLVKVQSDKYPELNFKFEKSMIVGKIVNHDGSPLPSYHSGVISLTSKTPLKDYKASINPDNTFSFDQVTPAELSLAADFSLADHRSFDTQTVKNLTLRKTINLLKGTPPLVLDLGNVPINKPIQEVSTGNTASDFTAKILSDNSSFKLSDYRGKYVVVDFSPAYSGFMFSQIADVNKAYKIFKDRDDVAFFSFVFKNTDDFDMTDPSSYNNKAKWPVAMLDNAADDAATKAFGASEFEAVFLISPDGQIIAKDNDMFGPNIAKTMEKLIPAK
ncbi:redoxin domain-containing protein [Planctomycetota bacterium]|nr:redoxin domain-containing protein [Planctomycetota bacterium]